MRDKLLEIIYIKLQKLKENYVDKQENPGIYSSNKDYYKNDKKIIRNLSQVSFRLLNYILYSNLFFAKLIVDKDDFDKCLPKKMTWKDILSES